MYFLSPLIVKLMALYIDLGPYNFFQRWSFISYSLFALLRQVKFLLASLATTLSYGWVQLSFIWFQQTFSYWLWPLLVKFKNISGVQMVSSLVIKWTILWKVKCHWKVNLWQNWLWRFLEINVCWKRRGRAGWRGGNIFARGQNNLRQLPTWERAVQYNITRTKGKRIIQIQTPIIILSDW